MAVAQKILNAVTTTGAVAFSPNLQTGNPEYNAGNVQVAITGTANVTLEGRSDSSAPWQVLKTYTASGVDYINWLPQMQFNVNSITPGSVSAWAMFSPAA